MSNPAVLEAKVRIVNAANRYVNEIAPKLREAFEKFLGKKALTASGDLRYDVRMALPTLANDSNLTAILRTSRYSVSCTVKTNETVKGIAYYHETTVYFGSISEDNVVPFDGTLPVFKTDYTAAEVQLMRETLASAKTTVSQLETMILPFGTYDR